MNLPWFKNSFGLLLLPAACWSLDCATVLIEDMLLCDWIPLFSISCALVLQKSSDKLAFLTERPWILKRLEGSSTAVIGVGLTQQPKQPLLCSKPGLASKRLAEDTQEPRHTTTCMTKVEKTKDHDHLWPNTRFLLRTAKKTTTKKPQSLCELSSQRLNISRGLVP